ncbi:MAG: hypothetical protein QW478_01820 [Candidatus Micrarchaeaceae archaeon]
MDKNSYMGIIEIFENLDKTCHSTYDIISEPYYDRRKSFIQQYAQLLIDIYSLCRKLSWLFGINCVSKISELENTYDYTWAKKDFYKKWTKYIGRIFYDYASSISYHRYKEICKESLSILRHIIKLKIKEILVLNSSNNAELINVLDLTYIDQKLQNEESLKNIICSMIKQFIEYINHAKNLYSAPDSK